MNNNKYKVSDELLGHALDVRSVDSCDTFILSGSKDTTVKIWKLDGYVFSVLHEVIGVHLHWTLN